MHRNGYYLKSIKIVEYNRKFSKSAFMQIVYFRE